MTIISLFNVRGVGDCDKFRRIIKLSQYINTNLIVLTETHLTSDRLLKLQREFPQFLMTTNCLDTNTGGVTFISLNPKFVNWRPEDVFYIGNEGRSLGINVSLHDDTQATASGTATTKVKIVGVYLPNTAVSAKAYLTNLHSELPPRGIDILMGDFNMVEDAIDRFPPHPDQGDLVTTMKLLTNTRRLDDGWRKAHSSGSADGFTFKSSNECLSRSRIDRVYVTDEVFGKSSKWQVAETPSSFDHRIVAFDYTPNVKIDRGPAPWRMNMAYFEKEAYQEGTERIIETSLQSVVGNWKEATKEDDKGQVIDRWFEKTSRSDPATTIKAWDAMITKVLTFASEFQVKKAQTKIKKRKRLERRLRHAEKLERTPRNIKRLQTAQDNLHSFLESQITAHEFNARAKGIDMNEGGSKHFWQLADPDKKTSAVMGLRDPEGENPEKVQTKTQRMLNIGQRYYQKLYTPDPVSEGSQRTCLGLLPEAPGLRSQDLLHPVKESEIRHVIKEWERGKSPGPDGIPYEWFKTFAKEERNGGALIRILLCVMNVLLLEQSAENYIQPRRWAEGIISVMYKDKGDVTELKNYRPLALTNSIYKMLTSILNNRIIEPINEVIGNHQTGFLPRRQIYDNIKLAQCLIDRAHQQKVPLYAALLDQEKAYDRVHHGFLWRALTKLGLPETLLCAIQNCYENAFAQVSINRHLSERVHLMRGVRQGDPLSCLLFDVNIEPFALLLIKNKNRLPGFTTDTGIRNIVSLYADDTMIFLTCVRQWMIVLDVYATYSKATNARLNEGKTEVVGVNDSPDRPTKMHGITIAYEGHSVRYLGIPVGLNVDYSPKWIQIKEAIAKKIENWSKIKSLSLRGRITVSKNIIYGKLYYHLRCMPCEKSYLDEISRVVFTFIWGMRTPTARGLVKREKIIRPVEEGGLNAMFLPTMMESLRMSWIQRLEFAARERNRNLIPPWTVVFRELVFHVQPPPLPSAVTHIWAQKWSMTNKRMPVSIDYFWRPWVKHRNKPKQPETKAEADSTLFWYHPVLTDLHKTAPDWGQPVWQRAINGEYGFVPRTFGDLRLLRKQDLSSICPLLEDIRERKVKMGILHRAIDRLFASLPNEWRQLWGDLDLGLPSRVTLQIHEHWLLTLKDGSAHLTISTDNKTRYRFLLRDVADQSDLLEYAMTCAARDGIRIPEGQLEQIWKRIKPKAGVIIPKASDLMWKILHDVVIGGQDWLKEKATCPLCRKRMIARHIFWECAGARAVWLELFRLWQQVTDETVILPASFGDVILAEVSILRKIRDPHTVRRWRIFHSEALWSIWVVKCSWSFDEISVYSERALVNMYRKRMMIRYKTDRQIALGHGFGSINPTDFAATWGRTPTDPAPDFLAEE
jgi:hypothetical protein